ncbi:M14 family metallopeptidase [Shewanella marina]|uniref:M14 family metallopeptidase n=1 Tax=Shewanella marina TaxID=487319 RepID=UPI00046EECE0|nr:M14-type cytosolic carboxypeptidase [Shewanella marina]
MRISSNFDGGNIDVLNIDDKDNIQLAIRADNDSQFLQWFNFRLTGNIGMQYTMHINNAGETSYPKGWEDYQAVASYDRQHWFRIPTEYKDGKLTMSLELECQEIQIAYFAPYSYERHLDLISAMQVHPDVELEHLGLTLDGRDMSLLKIGDGDADKKTIWITARQHPGETMAEWLVEGLLYALLDGDNANSKALLDKANFYVVPNMNPDGSARGHLRTNAAGVNLNREWLTPSLTQSPEVYYVVEKMKQTGVDLYFDVHGDEGLPYVFLAGCEGVECFDERLTQLQHDFVDALKLVSADFQAEHGYEKDEPGQANLTIASNWVAQTFNCLSNTLEMPFKDNANQPDPIVGWSPERSIYLGEASLTAMLAVVDKLR